ncbi:hypothetical protein CCHR01_07988 [Colletotrichum chrysophilum]|uniref:Uncharacterized protein n=1 Tax=Colletotrichum chrysophilum TaxID=1836956 RepID=A0AAD9ELX9_9PEZI|nr:hypothetical protein CCHR01_07988 [Colletotrichum chrysophilum]
MFDNLEVSWAVVATGQTERGRWGRLTALLCSEARPGHEVAKVRRGEEDGGRNGESVAGVWHNQPMKHEANSSRSSSAILARPAQTKSPKSPVVPGGSGAAPKALPPLIYRPVARPPS